MSLNLMLQIMSFNEIIQMVHEPHNTFYIEIFNDVFFNEVQGFSLIFIVLEIYCNKKVSPVWFEILWYVPVFVSLNQNWHLPKQILYISKYNISYRSLYPSAEGASQRVIFAKNERRFLGKYENK